MMNYSESIDKFLNNKQLSLQLRSAHITAQPKQYMMAAVLLSVLPFFAVMMVSVLLLINLIKYHTDPEP